MSLITLSFISRPPPPPLPACVAPPRHAAVAGSSSRTATSDKGQHADLAIIQVREGYHTYV